MDTNRERLLIAGNKLSAAGGKEDGPWGGWGTDGQEGPGRTVLGADPAQCGHVVSVSETSPMTNIIFMVLHPQRESPYACKSRMQHDCES